MAFGLTNAPAAFQRLMEHCLGDLNFKTCIVYIDDIIVYSKTFQEHIERLEAVFSRLEQYGLKLKKSKCSFFQAQVKFLGHIISAAGIQTDPDKIEAIKTWPVPTNLAELRTFLGFTGYYRKFVPEYARKAKPLNDLLTTLLKNASPSKVQTEKKSKWEWSTKCHAAFEELVNILSSPLVLTYPDFELPFLVNTDASQDGLGATLSQLQDGEEKVIAFASRALRKAEKNYPAHKLEFLALKWAVTDKFHEYLYGNQFTVRTDNNPLTYVTTTAKLDATGHRWMAALSTYNFSIVYRAGRKNKDADALSRRPQQDEDVEALPEQTVTREQFAAISGSMMGNGSQDELTLLETICDKEASLEATLENCGAGPGGTMPSLTADNLLKHQTEDKVISKVIMYLTQGTRFARFNHHLNLF